MTSALRITVVIPCRNDAEFLRECLRALQKQERPADRVIVVDNGSTDDTAAVAREAGVELIDEPLVGIWPAAARGYDAALPTSEIIARVDADSRPHPDWLARIEAAFEADQTLGVLTGGAEFYGAGRVVRYLGEHWYIGGGRFWVNLWLGIPLVFGSNFAMRSAIWERAREVVDRDNARIHDDLDLTIHLRESDGVRWDRTLTMPVSARPLTSVRGLARRVGRVVPTFAASWPEGAPWRRRETDYPQEGPGGDDAGVAVT
ncbi:glycosyltransferase family A protein [Microbacterium sp. bgisy207]|uniref:glycosyltransferase family A protein n=1 Tax=Microbacterium sp. bgisy207 TaxID=3413800 RepID=UPI003EC08DA6